ncbi:hypothetical protein BX616_008695, partial [Lobosporangium transversale]
NTLPNQHLSELNPSDMEIPWALLRSHSAGNVAFASPAAPLAIRPAISSLQPCAQTSILQQCTVEYELGDIFSLHLCNNRLESAKATDHIQSMMEILMPLEANALTLVQTRKSRPTSLPWTAVFVARK